MNLPSASRPRLIICAGMRRSGSTLQSQLVSALLGAGRVRSTNAAAAVTHKEELDGNSETRVLKCHKFVPQAPQWLAANELMVTCVYRDIRDVVASICSKYSVPAFGFVAGGAAEILREHEQWESLPGVHVARYEDMIADLPREIERLAAYLGVAIDAERAAALAEEFSPERQKSRIEAAFESGSSIAGRGANAHDGESLLHRNHLQSGVHGSYRRVLRWHEIAALEWVCRDWMTARGYQPDSTAATRFVAYSWFSMRSLAHSLKVRALGRKAEKADTAGTAND